MVYGVSAIAATALLSIPLRPPLIGCAATRTCAATSLPSALKPPVRRTWAAGR